MYYSKKVANLTEKSYLHVGISYLYIWMISFQRRQWTNLTAHCSWKEFLLPSLTLCESWYTSGPSRSHLTSLIWPCYWVKAAHRRALTSSRASVEGWMWLGAEEGKGGINGKGVVGRETCLLFIVSQLFCCLSSCRYRRLRTRKHILSVLCCNINCIKTPFLNNALPCLLHKHWHQVLWEITTVMHTRTPQDKNKS